MVYKYFFEKEKSKKFKKRTKLNFRINNFNTTKGKNILIKYKNLDKIFNQLKEKINKKYPNKKISKFTVRGLTKFGMKVIYSSGYSEINRNNIIKSVYYDEYLNGKSQYVINDYKLFYQLEFTINIIDK